MQNETTPASTHVTDHAPNLRPKLVIPAVYTLTCLLLCIFNMLTLFNDLLRVLIGVMFLLIPVTVICSTWGIVVVIRHFRLQCKTILLLLGHILGLLVAVYLIIVICMFPRIGPIS